MRTIAKLFGRSPFVPLQRHMEKVVECVDIGLKAFESLQKGDYANVLEIAKQVSVLEHDCDQIKHDIQSQLPRGIFMPIDRRNLLEMLQQQDQLADQIENVVTLLTLREIQLPQPLAADFKKLLDKNLEAFHGAVKIVNELDELLETGFGGAEAEQVREMVMAVAKSEHEADQLQITLLRGLFDETHRLSAAEMILWDKVFKEVSGLANVSERLANSIRRTLELK